MSDKLACFGADEVGGAIDDDRGNDNADADLFGGDDDTDVDISSEMGGA